MKATLLKYKKCNLITKIGLLTLLLCSTNLTYAEAYNGVMTEAKRSVMTPQEIEQRLKDGNQRFVTEKMVNRDLLAHASQSAQGQYPIAVILNCMDSRTPPEIVFDQGIGDVFAIRIAGNIINDDILGSMEFGTKIAGAKLIAVIGHTSCGAIRGACQQAKLGHLTALLQKIQPAVLQSKKMTKNPDCANSNFINEIAKDNVLLVIKQIQMQSPVLKQLMGHGKLGIIGGIQDLATGRVTFFDDKSIMPKP